MASHFFVFTNSAMSGDSDGVQDAVIQGYLNDTDSELSSLSHLDAPSESVYMAFGVLIAMLLVGLIIVLLAVTIRSQSGSGHGLISCANCRKCFSPCKLRKREESSVLRSNAVHPEGVLQATVISHHATDAVVDVKSSSPLQDIFVSQLSTITVTTSASETSLSSCETDWSAPPLFLYSPAASRTSLNTNDQGILIHPSGPAEDHDTKSKRNIRGKLKKLVKRKPPHDNYAIPIEFQDQLKQIYVY